MAKATTPAKATMPRRATLSKLGCPPGLGYAKDIRKMFNNQEIKCMKNGVPPFDLGKYEDVRANATRIYNAVNSGAMPMGLPAWTDDMVNTFGCWMQQGCKP